MAILQNSKEIYVNETERKPNLYAANVLAAVVVAIAIICIINELGIFTVNKILIRICFSLSLLFFIVMQYIVHNKRLIVHKASKFIFMGMVLFLVLTLTVLLNIHAVLTFVLPLLLATQYRSKAISNMALIGSCFCCSIASVLSYFFRTWSLLFLTGYIETFCRVTITTQDKNSLSTAETVFQILLYWSLPQVLTLVSFGFILFSATRSGIQSVKDRIQVVDLSNDLNRKLESITLMQEKVLCSMSDIIESRDIETGGHVRRTIEIVRLLAEALKNDPESSVSDEFCRNIVRSAPMHDLGKISIPDAILRKPGKLTAEEFEIVKLHPARSADIITEALTDIEDENLIKIAKNMALYHHERFDGTGYPKKLKGKEIPLEARIMAIADVYDALVSERCYKVPMSFTDAFDTIEKSMGSQFDPDLNRYFIACRTRIESFYSN